MTTQKHGGTRGGAGRKPVEGATLMKSIKLTPAQWDRARQIGGGKNAAEGIRRAIEAYQFNVAGPALAGE